MLREHYYHHQKIRILRLKEWAKGLLFGLVSCLVLASFIYSIKNESSVQFVRFLAQQSFPFEAILLEGIPGYSQPERARLEEVRSQSAATGMYLLTGVNVADPRTFFLSFFSPPPEGPTWLGWAYNPRDPEFEGPILEPIESSPPVQENTAASPPAGVSGSQQVLVGIYNTHNSECYSGDGGPDRRQGENGDVVTVGETLKSALAQHGIGAVHSLTIHDAENFMTAYSRSVNTATNLLKEYPTIRILIDLHRDGFPPGVAKETATVNGKEVSPVLIVIGKKNPHWQINDALAKQLIALGNKKYPGLFLDSISYADDARYNQHLSNGGILLEFGSQMNTLEEANRAAEDVADVLADYLKR
ncbi:stage II sporulation protein P [Desulfosporosinus acidiphilus SJ4]|uniref:Stage II sporulation protein P n=1 Tax=Desulfosporosinus acidiphilus (strain DSM 22704 / JCM 16185 / SJ4) TaxID=646529 RepID=I4DAT2_DESAJ|nr:stage II sporulation protein P [Desulfosporosinus acidiphilus]AFM42906.1 stage II sporulation protein P [Desulfosporosinus acidiphilus SJ4]